MENWRKRWEQLTEDVAIEGYLPNGEMASDSDIEDFISEELDKAREEERKIMIKTIESMKYKGDIEEFKHIKTAFDCKTVEEYVWFIGSMTLNRVISKLKDNK